MVEGWAAALTATAEPAHVLSGPALLALDLAENARGVRGLDVLRRSVDRAPPAWS
ncbi:hypothetical protein CLV30_10139 [Haloactinopolyspora alba]|uniref:Uncharacterized protein n=1 Tax=Haloactinopolyspora alba TaxID=648780 RepID=A0A2P8EF18_9ACTN|nr:hypothetical protein [Haloactinopolyspora alba]PSL08072.1 hypothetical protein CLV30_10139 [Haloactinopolyspora alba]